MLKKIIKFTVFTLLFFGLLFQAQDILALKSSRNNIATIYDLEEDSIDVLFAGTSHMLNGVSPMRLWEEYGIPSYNIAQSGQTFPLTYYSILEGCRVQDPDVIVVDLYYILYNSKEGNNAFMHSTLDVFEMSWVKLAAIWDGIPTELRSEFLFSISLYNNRWQELSESDFNPTGDVKRGASISFLSEVQNDFQQIDENATSEIGETAAEYILKIIEFCEKNDKSLIFTVIPYPPGEDNISIESDIQQGIFHAAEALADAHGVSVINYLDMYEEIGIDFQSDMRDGTHLNLLGIEKITTHIGSYLVDRYNLEDKSHDVEYEDWNEDYESYMAYESRTLNTQLSKVNSIYGYLDILENRDDYLIFITKAGDTFLLDESQSADLSHRFDQLGLSFDFTTNHSYLALINQTEVIEEEQGTELVRVENEIHDIYYKLLSTTTSEYGKQLIDGKQIAVNKNGLNISVYCISSKKVIDSVCFDIQDGEIVTIR